MKSLVKSALKTLLISDREKDICILGRRLYCRPRQDFHLFRLALSQRLAPSHHELSAIVSLMGFAAPGVTFVDIGANIGLFSAAFASVGQILGFDVVAIEPNPETVLRLKKTLSEFNNCVIHSCACSNDNGVVALRYGFDSQTAYIDSSLNARKAHTNQDVEVVESRTLDSLLGDATNQIIMKVDVEGHEKETLEGAGELLRARRVNAILIDSVGNANKQWLHSLGYTSYEAHSLRRTNQGYSLLYVLT